MPVIDRAALAETVLGGVERAEASWNFVAYTGLVQQRGDDCGGVGPPAE